MFEYVNKKSQEKMLKSHRVKRRTKYNKKRKGFQGTPYWKEGAVNNEESVNSEIVNIEIVNNESVNIENQNETTTELTTNTNPEENIDQTGDTSLLTTSGEKIVDIEASTPKNSQEKISGYRIVDMILRFLQLFLIIPSIPFHYRYYMHYYHIDRAF